MAAVKKKSINGRVILMGIFLVYLIGNGILLLRHEPWRDEANVWLIARALSPAELFAEIKYQGHPCLWYLLVMPFAKLGLPFRSIGVLSFLVMGAGAGLFLWKAPFNLAVKAACLFSPAFTYFYADIARNYCLIALVLMLLAVCYPSRNEKAILYGFLLGLLVQTDTVVLAAAGMISLMWLCENVRLSIREKSAGPLVRVLKGIWIPLASFFLWVAQFYQVSDSPVFQINDLGIRDLVREIRTCCLWIPERLTGQEKVFCLLLLVLFLGALAVVSARLKSFWAMAVMAAAYLFQAFFSVVVYQLHLWHFIALCFVLLWTIWILYEQRKEMCPEDRISRNILAGLELLLVVLAGCMFMQWNSEEESSSLPNALHGLYSDGENTAEYIRQEIGEEEVLVSANVPLVSTVQAYLPEYVFYFAGTGSQVSYADYSREQEQKIELDELVVWAEKNFPEKKGFYLVDSEDSCVESREGLEEYEMLYQTGQETVSGEEYRIYYIIMGKERF